MLGSQEPGRKPAPVRNFWEGATFFTWDENPNSPWWSLDSRSALASAPARQIRTTPALLRRRARAANHNRSPRRTMTLCYSRAPMTQGQFQG